MQVLLQTKTLCKTKAATSNAGAPIRSMRAGESSRCTNSPLFVMQARVCAVPTSSKLLHTITCLNQHCSPNLQLPNWYSKHTPCDCPPLPPLPPPLPPLLRPPLLLPLARRPPPLPDMMDVVNEFFNFRLLTSIYDVVQRLLVPFATNKQTQFGMWLKAVCHLP